MKQPLAIRQEDIDELQSIMHYHGLTEFKELLRQAYFRASDDMEDLDLAAAEMYRTEANKIELEE